MDKKEVKLKGYVARSSCRSSKSANEFRGMEKDNEGALSFHTAKPERTAWFWHSRTGEYLMLSKPGPQTMFKDLTWNDEPLEVEITITVPQSLT
jgi:hypothetical protein